MKHISKSTNRNPITKLIEATIDPDWDPANPSWIVIQSSSDDEFEEVRILKRFTGLLAGDRASAWASNHKALIKHVVIEASEKVEGEADARRKKVFDLMLSVVRGECTEITLEEAIKYGNEIIDGANEPKP